ncbi:PAS domain-containing sensor histidine kinase [Pedobacter gandavensis]|uniref:PAS domain S-box protein n=1 Tax=Pedobacter gandavensis TaxID=2679963 RepID=A0ABR6EYR2_9SPHI|nr:PAS domain S-box protein [Pedobacter gandavensis]MBB2150396.1 PAS domain S-box protein [Pedobacter gandavensis]
MKKKVSKKSNREKVISLLRARIGRSYDPSLSLNKQISDHELEVLLEELQIFQLELEMQNDELSNSYELLELERTKFVDFFNLAPVGYFIIDHAGLVQEANQTGADMLATLKLNIIDKKFQDFIPSQERDKLYAFLHQMNSAKTKHNCELKLLMAGGHECDTRMEGIAIVDPATNNNKYYITVIDISESKFAQRELLKTTQRLEMTLNASGTGTWWLDLDGDKLFLDEFSYSVLELMKWEFDGTITGLVSLVHPDDKERVTEVLLQTLNSFDDMDLEFRIITKNGEIKNIVAKGHEVVTEIVPRYFAGILMNVTAQKKLAKEAAELQELQKRLVLSTAFNAQEKERYRISSALHDSVCQILYGIRLNLQNIQLSKNLRGEFVNVNKLLDQAIGETRELSYELTPSVLRDFGFVSGVKEMAQRLSTPKFEIKIVIKEVILPINEEVQLYVFRMIQELINNCIKHAHATEAKIIISPAGENVNIVFSDNGRGFEKEVKDSLFLGSGIRAIQNRIFLLNGKMHINTGKTGTTISIQFNRGSELTKNAGTLS